MKRDKQIKPKPYTPPRGDFRNVERGKRELAEIDAALEEAAKSAARHFIPGHSVAGPAFAQDGAEKIRALKIP